MFCRNCGAQLANGAKFCSSCGNTITDATLTNDSDAYTSANKVSKEKSLIGIIVLVVVITTVITLFFDGNGYKNTVDNFFEGLFEADAKLFVSTFSDSFIEEQLEINGYRNKAVLIEKTQANLDNLAGEYVDEFGKKWSYEYKIIDTNEYEDEVEVTVTIKLSGKNKEESDVWTLLLTKEGSKWYIDTFYNN